MKSFFKYLFTFFSSSCDKPKKVESINGKEIIDIACGGAHSACITSSGQLYTWGKGRYGRLGHGDSEDQLKPKRVCALILTALCLKFHQAHIYKNKN